MISSVSIFVLTVVVITWILGTFFNSLILSAYIRDCRQSLNLGDYDKIVFLMASVKVLLQCLITYGGILFYGELYRLLSNETFLPFFVILLSSVDMCFWNTCWLSVFYCLKLVNISHQAFQWLKSSFSSALPLLILGSVVGNTAINLPFFWTTEIHFLQNVTGNSSINTYSFNMDFSFAACNVMLTCCLPFLITFLCIIFCITSLLRHVRRICKNEPKVQYSRIQAHIQASRTMVLRLFLDLIFILNICCWLENEFNIYTKPVSRIRGNLTQKTV
ncbi:PREDICTED: taste receptor type 2 member 41-like [Nanorana parkeri]|uniref:taste receptor type 2 member 41-like n=1 Tax=Nanorana parkeri TaxID=125878 RepID=UPI0008544919|nr:PREDICTED: taste receptor type 2 member 41-like [Nanorana parkeri]